LTHRDGFGLGPCHLRPQTDPEQDLSLTIASGTVKGGGGRE